MSDLKYMIRATRVSLHAMNVDEAIDKNIEPNPKSTAIMNIVKVDTYDDGKEGVYALKVGEGREIYVDVCDKNWEQLEAKKLFGRYAVVSSKNTDSTN